MDWVTSGKTAGTTGKERQIEALEIKLTGKFSELFDVYYRTHLKDYGWLDWTKNGNIAGSTGCGIQLEAVQIKLVKKGEKIGNGGKASYSKPALTYNVHLQDIGWQGTKQEGEVAGTIGEKRQVEAICIALKDFTGNSAISYQTHLADIGWTDWKNDGQKSGTIGEGRQCEAIRIKINDNLSHAFDIYYRVHVADMGWLGWTNNGHTAGTTGCGLRVEAIQIALVNKDTSYGDGSPAYYSKPRLTYNVHLQDVGWQGTKQEGEIAGTIGEERRMEAICIALKDFAGNPAISYQTHLADVGWSGWKNDGQRSGTVGEDRQCEAIQITINDNLSRFFDIYYRVHVADMGWLGWTSNGQSAGTTGCGLRVEAIQIVLVNKGTPFGDGLPAFYQKTNVPKSVNTNNKERALNWCNGLVGSKVGSGQCVALIQAYYNYLGASTVYGNGCDYARNQLPAGWSRVKGGVPEAGDILVYTGAKYGHVAIYAGGTASYHQNISGHYVEKIANWNYNKSWYSKSEGGTKTYWGYIRPKF